MAAISIINYGIAIFFAVCYFYHLVYILVSLFKKAKPFQSAPPHRFAVVIPARNEEAVIGQLLESINRQNYPKEYIETFIVADNCTDKTAEIARQAGATVWERFDTQRIGKGHALSFLFSRIMESKKSFDGYIVLDADNLLDQNYVGEMNKAFSAGHRIITSYRNSKNYGSNWISAGYSLWFLREAKYLNNPRMLLGISCSVSGTGFLVHRDIIEKNEGWKHFLLTEDIEFSVASILAGERIAYCGSAILYDEQPTRFDQAWKQRLRWSKGSMQVFRAYGWRLLKQFMVSGNFACYDMLITVLPVIVLALISFALNVCAGVMCAAVSSSQFMVFLQSVWSALYSGYFFLFILGLLTLITEWKQIHCSPGKKILYLLLFPVFMTTFVPISAVALFKKVSWDAIHHKVNEIL